MDNWQTVEAPAIKDPTTGQVWSVPKPGRHHDVMRLMCENGYLTVPSDFVQGFVLADGRFVDRWNARRHAIRSGQITTTKWGKDLYSEDLW